MKRARRPQLRFAVCTKNKGYEASLEVGKLYRVIPDRSAAGHGYLRIVDESGDDYGYSADRFFAIDLPKPLEKALLKAAS
ncbi:MAG: hypothetical protein HYV94_11815 [Candidatus Rokubacteria bacterium]|nr:hypothetical protein [Candidatus Rokubacteria bacterium]